jgi:galactose-1-phosphate uridylyltransferase
MPPGRRIKATPAGFEMGSDIYINASFPEEAAQFLKE